jgi:thimet oligopeptidase
MKFRINFSNLWSVNLINFAVLVWCQSSNAFLPMPAITDAKPAAATAQFIRSDYAPQELTKLCQGSIQKTTQKLNAIAAIPEAKRDYDNVNLAFESVLADLSDQITPLTFMGYVSTDTKLNAEGSACEQSAGQFNVAIFTRRDLYAPLKAQKPRDAFETRLQIKTIESFEQSGLKLSDEKLAKVKALKSTLAAKEAEFSKNLNNDVSEVEFTESELAGVPKDFVAGLKKSPKGLLIVTTKSTDYTMVAENAQNPETRKKLQLAYLNRAALLNTPILTEAVGLRAQIAQVMGYSNWADERIDGRMAKDSATVLKFLNALKEKLAARNRSDLKQLLDYKKQLDPKASVLNPWDVGFLSYQLRKRDYNLDTEKIREYFPADVVISQMFKVYSQMLSVTYREVTDAKVWAPGVKLFEIHNSGDKRLIGYFYTDFNPRPGKYGHAAAFSLISGRMLDAKTYSFPISSIVANITPPTKTKPSLLSHDEVETVFHEFGHIMHQTLTRAPYASLSGSSVAQDFVEAPSQMLENWVWNKKILKQLSGHYLNHKQKLPDAIVTKMLAAKDFGQGIVYTKQLLYALFDMQLHTQNNSSIDVTKTYDDLYREIIGLEPLEGAHFPASFGHLMGGYDAGYYGYLWSQVYAQDMFSKFPIKDLASAEVGAQYRKTILESGNMRDALDLLREFLGREPNADAFFKMLHISQ